MFEEFMADDGAYDMYVTGAAGTGKTTQLRKDIEYCIANEIPYVACAYTHKACSILRSKLPEGAVVRTLHSFLGKRPTVNTNAVHKEHVNISSKVGATDEEPRVMFLDEYSMIGEQDYIDIQASQDPDYEARPALKVVWLGDANQLPPVGDQQAIVPYGRYQLVLTKQWRNDNPIQRPLNSLIGFLEGHKPHPLEEVDDYFIRNKNIVTEYTELQNHDKIMLAYTNKNVEMLNAVAQGYDSPRGGETVFSPTTNKLYTFMGFIDNPDYIDLHYTDPLHKGSKYRTLEHLISSDLCQFAELQDEDGDIYQMAVKFGHYEYKITREALESEAVETNKAIERAKPGYKAAAWAKANSRDKLARARAVAWRNCLSFKDCVVCLDFNHAMTVHKSQGSTFHTVFIDTDDLSVCAARNFKMYVKLMYVAISRASHKVITN